MTICHEIKARHCDLYCQEAAGAGGFLTDIAWLIQRAQTLSANGVWVILRAADCFAYIRFSDLWVPWRFLGQMAGAPPVEYGAQGFRTDLVDDQNPARHYTAFVLLGYFLPVVAAQIVLWLWEILGFVRYRGEWSWPDVICGQVGIRHGALLRRTSVVVWPGLIACDLIEPGEGPAANRTD